jgi:hypothetical protein
MYSQTIAQVVDHFAAANKVLAEQIDTLHKQLELKDATIQQLSNKIATLEKEIQPTPDTKPLQFKKTQSLVDFKLGSQKCDKRGNNDPSKPFSEYLRLLRLESEEQK